MPKIKKLRKRLSSSIRGFHNIDGRVVFTDSNMEAKIIRRLIKHGFEGRWHRYGFGTAVGIFRYTPDVHLSIRHDDMNRRALVEFKPYSASQFAKRDRLRMLAASKFFRDALCFLYVERTQQWYLIEVNGSLLKTNEPTPGFVPISELPRPRFMVPIFNRYGRIYWERPGMFVARKTAGGIGFMLREVFGTDIREKKRTHRKKK